MSVAIRRGSTTGASDLSITVRDTGGSLIDPYRLEYAVYDKTTGVEVLIGSPVNTPIRVSTGNYYAEVQIAADANIGDWLVRWTIQETALDPVYQSVQVFNVVGDSTVVSFSGDVNLDKLIYSLRIILRDNSPDRNYSFRPPASAKFIQGQTQVFGFIWEDEELLEYLYMAIDDFNTYPPVTGIELSDLWGTMRRWRTAIILRAAAFACFAIAMNWIADEFSVDGKEKLRIRIGPNGKDIEVSIAVLFMILYGDAVDEGARNAREGMKEIGLTVSDDPSQSTDSMVIGGLYKAADLKNAYETGNLFILSMDSDKKVDWTPVEKVMRVECAHKRVYEVGTESGSVTVTEDHSLFDWETGSPIKSKDICKDSFLVSEKAGSISATRVISISEVKPRKYMYDLSIPKSQNFFLANGLLAHNTYSISGVSLDIEKSSKYQGMKDEYIGEYDKLVEAAKRSIKLIKGLRQYRYGVGLSSALGPMSRPGIQSRRNYVSTGYGRYV